MMMGLMKHLCVRQSHAPLGSLHAAMGDVSRILGFAMVRMIVVMQVMKIVILVLIGILHAQLPTFSVKMVYIFMIFEISFCYLYHLPNKFSL